MSYQRPLASKIHLSLKLFFPTRSFLVSRRLEIFERSSANTSVATLSQVLTATTVQNTLNYLNLEKVNIGRVVNSPAFTCKRRTGSRIRCASKKFLQRHSKIVLNTNLFKQLA